MESCYSSTLGSVPWPLHAAAHSAGGAQPGGAPAGLPGQAGAGAGAGQAGQDHRPRPRPPPLQCQGEQGIIIGIANAIGHLLLSCPQWPGGRIDKSDADLVQIIHSDAGGLGLEVSQGLREVM